MKSFIIRYIFIACVILVIPRYLKGITVDGFTTALLVALAMGFVNSFVKPVLKFLSFTRDNSACFLYVQIVHC